jgi:2-dehydro-3-deoxygluconokinase
MVDVVTFGECMALVYPPEPVGLAESAALHLDIAGAESNLCIGLSRLGVAARFISRVGNDPFGERIRSVLRREGVDVSALIVDASASTGLFFREHLPDGQRRVYYYRRDSAASRLAPEDLRPEMFAGARLVHFSGITPALSASCAAACWRALELARQVGAAISFDPNFRPRLWDAQTAGKALRPFLPQVDLLLMGHEDAQALFGSSNEQEALRLAAVAGVKVPVLKRAERGACAWKAGALVETPAYPARQVVDPVGAGDGFDAGFLAGWLRGNSLEDCLRLGARIGAAAVEVMGDYAGYPKLVLAAPPR